MGYTNRIDWDSLKSIDSATFTGSYQLLGTLDHPSVVLKLVNNSNVLILISIDGVNDIDVAPAGSFWLYDENTSNGGGREAVPKGTSIYVKGVAGSGSVYLVSQFIVQTIPRT